ncbi:hypothetical protein NKI19_05840 [Mesorhizobium sp. M0751]|uniref:SAM-dependent methyltransferase n=1 Tax=unclassified Mesorhizobium TaxID=325217 RepID=UPI0033354385
MGNVTSHYGSEGSDGIVDRILAAIPDADPAGKLAAAQLYPFDQFHGRELIATQEHAARLAPSPTDRILDIGSGIGGPARFLASTYGCEVDGIDLTPAFCRRVEPTDRTQRTGRQGSLPSGRRDETAF